MMNYGKILSVLVALLVAMSASGQVLFDGKRPAVDYLTGSLLISVPEIVYGGDYTAQVTLEDSVTRCVIDGVVVSDSFTFNNVQPDATYQLQVYRGSVVLNANIQFTYWPVIQIYGNFVKRPQAAQLQRATARSTTST